MHIDFYEDRGFGTDSFARSLACESEGNRDVLISLLSFRPGQFHLSLLLCVFSIHNKFGWFSPPAVIALSLVLFSE